MGHLVNPTSLQMGHNRYWFSIWALASSSNYAALQARDHQLVEFTARLFRKIRNMPKRRAFHFSCHRVKIFRSASVTYLLLYLWLDSAKFVQNVLRGLLWDQTWVHGSVEGRIGPAVEMTLSHEPVLPFMGGVTEQLHNKPFNAESIAWANLFVTKRMTRNILRVVSPAGATMSFSNFLAIRSELVRFLLYKNWLCNLEKLLNTLLLRVGGSENQAARTGIFFSCSVTPVPSAAFIAGYLSSTLRLGKRPVRSTFFRIVKYLRRLVERGRIAGFKVACSGRFARRGRANLLWQSGGKIGPTNPFLRIDYCLETCILVNSLCGIRVWISSPAHAGVFGVV